MIGRVSDVLGAYLHDERALTVTQLSRRTGLPKATTSRIANAMVEHGLLERDGDDFKLGLRIFELGQQASRSTDLRKVALPYMSELMAATRQTVHLAVREGSEVVYIQILRSRQGPVLPSRVGGRLPAHATGVGKALLAFAEPADLELVLSSPLRRVGPRTITDPARLRDVLADVRADRLAYEREESAPDLGCAAAPILDAEGRAIAAISVTVHIHLTDLTQMGPAVSSTARMLSRQLGDRRRRA